MRRSFKCQCDVDAATLNAQCGTGGITGTSATGTATTAITAADRGCVNTVCGGLIDTDALAHFPDADEMKALAVKITPMGRLGTPEDMAGVVAMLVSDDARFITGQVIVADGGLSVV